MGMDIGAAGFFGLEVDLDGQVAAAFDHKRLGTQVVQILAGDRVSGSDDHTVRLWRLPDGVMLRTLEEHTGSVRCLAISPDGWLLASGSQDEIVRLWGLGPLYLNRLPIAQTSLEDVALVQEALQGEEISTAEREWLEFLSALMHWYRRFDIEVGETFRRIPVREFDIEIE